MTKPREFWLARESCWTAHPRHTNDYYLCSAKVFVDDDGDVMTVRDCEPRVFECFCAPKFERCTGIRLNPGEDPVRVRLTMEIVG